MRTLRPRPIDHLPDLYWISPEQLRLALGRSSYLWRKIDLPYLRSSFPPFQLGPNGVEDARWKLDDIAERYPYLTAHFPPNTTFLQRFRLRQRQATAVASKQSVVAEVAA
jgi:hypothetical protein